VLVDGRPGRDDAKGEPTKTTIGRKMMKSARRARTKGRLNSMFFEGSSVRARLASEWPTWLKVAEVNILIHAVRTTIDEYGKKNNK
jgi:hypothetical protein